jgi:prophage regulatory protein
MGRRRSDRLREDQGAKDSVTSPRRRQPRPAVLSREHRPQTARSVARAVWRHRALQDAARAVSYLRRVLACSSGGSLESPAGSHHFRSQWRPTLSREAPNPCAPRAPHLESFATMTSATIATARPERLLRLPEVRQLAGMSTSTLYLKMSRGEFPSPVRIGSRAVAWRSSDVAAWQASLPNARASAPQPAAEAA